MKGKVVSFVLLGIALAACQRSINYTHQEKYFFLKNGILYYKGDPFEGELVRYFENGQLKEKGNYLEGLNEGPWEAYFENGQLAREGKFSAGKEEGLWKSYDQYGKPAYHGNYKGGKEEGWWEIYTDGVIQRKVLYNNGEVIKGETFDKQEIVE